MPVEFKPGDRVRHKNARADEATSGLAGTALVVESRPWVPSIRLWHNDGTQSEHTPEDLVIVGRATYLSPQDEADLRIGRRLRAEYDRQLAAFRASGSPWAHLPSPSFDFGATTVREIIDGE